MEPESYKQGASSLVTIVYSIAHFAIRTSMALALGCGLVHLLVQACLTQKINDKRVAWKPKYCRPLPEDTQLGGEEHLDSLAKRPTYALALASHPLLRAGHVCGNMYVHMCDDG